MFLVCYHSPEDALTLPNQSKSTDSSLPQSYEDTVDQLLQQLPLVWRLLFCLFVKTLKRLLCNFLIHTCGSHKPSHPHRASYLPLKSFYIRVEYSYSSITIHPVNKREVIYRTSQSFDTFSFSVYSWLYFVYFCIM